MNAPSRTRWKIACLLCGLAVVNYFQRVNISVAGDPIMKAFRLTQTQMGNVFSAFVLGYTLFQIPGGMLADRFGPRQVLGWAALSWGLFTFLTGAAGKISLLTGVSILNALIVLRFLFGLCEGPMFPASARAVANWFPLTERARANGLAITGVSVGSFLMPPLVSWMVLKLSWESSFFLSAAFSILIARAWFLCARDLPAQHWAVNALELKTIQKGMSRDIHPGSGSSSLLLSLRSGNLWRLVASYTLSGYVSYVFIFWFYLYLVQVRKFGQAESAWLTTVPWILAAFTTMVGGYLSDRLIMTRLGMDWGRRIVPMACQIGAAVFLTIGARVENGYVAAAVLSICTGLILGVEGPYWATANQISDKNVGFTGGLLNTGSNLGGVLSPTLTPFLAEHYGWVRALDFTGLVALGAALLWLSVSPSKK
ncbi:MAG: MFS transporter [Acidobacteria bacterium]|nr:MFS transporter [Acidobacteriota bacterium]MCI0717602.1 MFS transporter [Acidobacteriota bacterium]